MSWPAALGVYADLVYARVDGEIRSNMAFAEYIGALAGRCEKLVVFGRLAPPGRAGECVHPLGAGAEFVELPYYDSVANLPAVYRARGASVSAFAGELPGLDCAWLFGPHPLSLAFARAAAEAGVPAALGVRQDQPAYMRSRLHGAKRLFGVPYFDRLERKWRRLARELPVLTAGDQLAELYGGAPNAHATAFSLVRAADVAAEPVETARGGGIPRERPVRVLSVGRLDPEKNPLLLAVIAERLAGGEPDRRYELTIVGDGPLENTLRAEVARRGVSESVEFAGYVPFGPRLDDLYRRSDLLLHVSHTEGLPQVLIEAMAAGLPMVATAVGGVAAAVEGTGTQLVPPDDAAAAALAVAALASRDDARAEQARRGLERARELTVEAQQADALAHIARRYGKVSA